MICAETFVYIKTKYSLCPRKRYHPMVSAPAYSHLTALLAPRCKAGARRADSYATGCAYADNSHVTTYISSYYPPHCRFYGCEGQHGQGWFSHSVCRTYCVRRTLLALYKGIFAPVGEGSSKGRTNLVS